MRATTSSKKFIEDLAEIALQILGEPVILDLVKQWQNAGILSRKQAYDLRQVIKRLSKPSTPEHSDQNR